MTPALRRPALAAAALRVAPLREGNPATLLQDHYERIWRTRMGDMPFVNAALGVEAIGFSRHQGDWLGVVVTPWFLNLFLLNGGGTLWQDTSAGTRRTVALPCGALEFIADDDTELGLVQYCPLIAPVTSLADMAIARQAAGDALTAVLTAPLAQETRASPPELNPGSSRRAFMGRLTGRQ